MNLSTLAACAVALSSLAVTRTEPVAQFDSHPDDILIDTAIPLAVSGLPPRTPVVIHLRGGLDGQWTSNATFTADAGGRVDLSRMAPSSGSYKDIDPMGLFWSAERTAPSSVSEDDVDEPAPDEWTLTAEAAGAVVARTTVRRRAVSPTVHVEIRARRRDGGNVLRARRKWSSSRVSGAHRLWRRPAAGCGPGGRPRFARLCSPRARVLWRRRTAAHAVEHSARVFRHGAAMACRTAVGRSSPHRRARRIARRRARAASRLDLSDDPHRCRIHAEQRREPRMLRCEHAGRVDCTRAARSRPFSG